jgi:hypothetical protein
MTTIRYDAEREAAKARRLGKDYIAPWVGFDLDRTLAVYKDFVSPEHIGEPIPAMVELLQAYLMEGWQVKIFTARVSDPNPRNRLMTIDAIERWCLANIGRVLPVTCIKDFGCVRIYDDRAVQVEPNTGRIITEEL